MSTTTEPDSTTPPEPDSTTPREPDDQTPEQRPDDDPQQAQERPAQREARYRREAREAQAESTRLRGLLERHHRAEVAAVAGEVLSDPDDLLLTTSLADLLDADGSVDAGKVRQAAEAAARDRPHWAVEREPYAGPLRRGGSDPGQQSATTWSGILRKGR